MAKLQFGWRWTWALVGCLSWFTVGCNPQTLSMLFMPFTDSNVQPEYKLFGTDKEITLAILSNFDSPEIHPDLQPADAELAEQMGQAIRKRCADNKHKIKIVPYAQVRSEYFKQRTSGDGSGPVELGKNLKADYVLDLTIKSFSLYEKGYIPPMYRGKTDVIVNLYKVKDKDGEHKVFTREFPRLFPARSGPIDAGNATPSAFRTAFVGKVANDIAKMFLAYPPEENRVLE